MILSLPWYVRFGVDVGMIVAPVYVIASNTIFFISEYPRGITHFLTEKRRL
jgi:hypothetical protein